MVFLSFEQWTQSREQRGGKLSAVILPRNGMLPKSEYLVFCQQLYTMSINWKWFNVFSKDRRTLLERLPESLNSAFHRNDGTGTTEYPEATRIPIHSPYPNPPLHHPLSNRRYISECKAGITNAIYMAQKTAWEQKRSIWKVTFVSSFRNGITRFHILW